ncbi:BA75_03992T0 [Komagataella pastoris]|uniref:DNA replication complex GINS protein SLD5 n=1 Tax=Komagataella pastoris TaxID=4922 RepID=A0A1B2JGD0_PICPA|nr:BA75_03992T0 [Komagataella pastoris]
MDIDDILKAFDQETSRPQRSQSKLYSQDYDSLKKAWINERTSPELLHYEVDLMERILKRIRQQMEFIELNSIELQSSEEKDIKLLLVIIESELDRVNFVVRSYLRTRLDKIDKFTIYIHNEQQELKKLSPEETEYMNRHLEILVELYNKQFLSKLPESLHTLDDTSGGISMIESPDLSKSVFIRVLKDIEIPIVIGGEEIDMKQDEIYVLSYRLVKDLIQAEEVALI